ncbi:MAG: putative sensor domain DACNV-containing protein [Chthoniobacterales bacterium]
MTQRLQSYLGYSYPSQLTELVKKVWPLEAMEALPSDGQLRLLFDVAYHASLLKEELRPVTFRLLCADPSLIPQDAGPPSGLTPLCLDRARPYNEQEIRRISVGADFFRSLIGVCPDPDGALKIWGVVVSGTRWVNAVDGGRFAGVPMPTRLVIHALSPGRLTVFVGHKRIAALSSGQMEANAFDLFQSNWLPAAFAGVREYMMERIYGDSTKFLYVPIKVDFIRVMTQNVLRRTLSVVRDSKHGGTLVFVEPEEQALFVRSEHEGPMRFKYRFAEHESRSRYQRLLTRAVQRLTELAHKNQIFSVGWEDYQKIADAELSELDEGFFEFAHFLADLMTVDGALVLNKRYELIGFGAELRSDAPRLGQVRKALDVEAAIWVNEPLDDVGTRHRAVYRLCDRYPNCVAVVISQDASVRFVKKHNGAVTYWDQLSW